MIRENRKILAMTLGEYWRERALEAELAVKRLTAERDEARDWARRLYREVGEVKHEIS